MKHIMQELNVLNDKGMVMYTKIEESNKEEKKTPTVSENKNSYKIPVKFDMVISDYINRLQQLLMLAFNADLYAEQEVFHLIKYTNTKIGIETGTSFGSTTLCLSSILSKIYSIEINDDSYDRAKQSLGPIGNIKLCLGSSEKILEHIFKTEDLKENIFFYLDAHWNDYWPILDELEIIAKYCGDRAIICIDDFQVPYRNFGYDSYKGQPLNFEYIKEKISKIYPAGYTYWYGDKAKGRPGYEYKGTAGKFYAVSNKININWLKQENRINYSNLW
jgi:hypothetical protein